MKTAPAVYKRDHHQFGAWSGQTKDRMKVVERYVLRRMLGIFLTTLVWVLAIVWTTQVLIRIDLVTSNGQSALAFFKVAGLVLPAVVPIVIPFALGIAVALTLATMNSDSELVVLAAAGSPRSTIIRPAVLLGLVSCLAAFSIENFVEPHSRTQLRQTIAESRTQLLTSVIREGTFHRIDDGLSIQIAERLPSGQFRGIFVADDRTPGASLVYYAGTGEARQDGDRQLLVMRDGVIQRKNADGAISTIRYTSYAFDLSEFTSSTGPVTYSPKYRTLSYLANPAPDDQAYQSNPQSFRAEFHRRLTDWLYPLVFALIGVAVASDARSFREARFHPMITTMGFALVVRWAGFFVANEAGSSQAYVPAMYAVPLLAIGGLIVMIARSKPLEVPTAWAESIMALVARAHDWISSMRLVGWAKRLVGDSR